MKTLMLTLALWNPIVGLDGVVQRMAQESRRPALEGPMRSMTKIGKPLNVIAALLAIALLDPVGVPTARLAVVALAATNVVVEVTKRAVNRTRPDGESKPSNASFPSSHAANAFALAAVFARRWRRLGVVFWIWAAAVAWSRVYLHRHYLSDIVIGAAVGILCTWLIARWLGPRWEVRREVEGPPRDVSPEVA